MSNNGNVQTAIALRVVRYPDSQGCIGLKPLRDGRLRGQWGRSRHKVTPASARQDADRAPLGPLPAQRTEEHVQITPHSFP